MPSAEAQVAARGDSIHEFRKTTRKMRWWYESLADFMIANPNATQNEIATYFGRQPCTISTIINTDAFKAYFRQRRAVHAEKLDEGVRDRLFKVTEKSLDYILDVLDKKRDTIPLEMLQRVADSSLKNLGYGVAPPASHSVNINNQPTTVHVAVSLQDLEQARAALRRQQSMTIEGAGTRGGDRVSDEPALPSTMKELDDGQTVLSPEEGLAAPKSEGPHGQAGGAEEGAPDPLDAADGIRSLA